MFTKMYLQTKAKSKRGKYGKGAEEYGRVVEREMIEGCIEIIQLASVVLIM